MIATKQSHIKHIKQKGNQKSTSFKNLTRIIRKPSHNLIALQKKPIYP